jgi:uncharacterized protein YhaN
MKFVHIELDGFGVWNDLALRNLSPDCTVFYGLNEAGKTTLLEFVRGVLYGYTPKRASRYLPPVHGGSPGGVLAVSDVEDGQLRIARRPSSGQPLGTVTVEASDGTVQGDPHLERLLHDVDEQTFENVFAVGLRELQELGTLNDLEAARWLYELTVGMDRVSILKVMRELDQSRQRIRNDGTQSSPIDRLAMRHDRLKQEISELADSSGRYGQLLAERALSQQRTAQLEQTLATGEAECRTLEAAALVCDVWRRREELNAQIGACGAAADWPPDALARMDRLCRNIRRLKVNIGRLTAKCRRRRTEFSQIKLNDAIWRQSARIAALVENEPWIASLEQAIGQGELTVSQLTAQCNASEKAVGILGQLSGQSQSVGLATRWHEQIWKRLRRPAADLAGSRKRLRAACRKVDQHRTTASQSHDEVKRALATRKQGDLTSAIDAAGKQVAQLRNRIQLDDRFNQLAQTKLDLEQQILDLAERQILPPWTLVTLGGVFVLSMVLLLGGLLLPTSFIGAIGWPMAWLGLLGMVCAVAAKFTMERSMSLQLDAVRKQLGLAASQTDSVSQQRDESDAALPKDPRPLSARLEVAQRELAELEKLLPLDAERQSAQQEAVRKEAVLGEARAKLSRARHRWRQALVAVGLSDSLSPREVREKLAAASQLKAMQRQLADAQADLDRRRQELAAVAARVAPVFEASQIESASGELTARLRQLRRDLAAQESLHQEQDALRRRLRRLHQRKELTCRRLGVLRRRRTRLLKQCGETSVAGFRRSAAEFSRIATLIEQRDAHTRDIDAAIRPVAVESVIALIVSGKTPRQLEDELTTKRQDCQQIRSELRQVIERCGQLADLIRQLVEDRRLAAKRFELSQVESQLAHLRHQVRVLAMTSRALEQVKAAYERTRQPETLREASEYLSQLTAGRYLRVWTQLGQNVLLVDNSDGRSLSIEVLSHGTREQLFLSLRLALVGLFARRGIALPLVLDDVLVNFDAPRAKAAVQVLREFSKRGHQILMLTCHEHIAGLCRTSEIDVRRLPDHRDGNRDQGLEIEVDAQPKRHRARRSKEAPPIPLPEATLSPTPTQTLALLPNRSEPPPMTSPWPSTDDSERSPLISHFRIDLPQRPARPSAIMHRWGAEEFSGELDDQVNPLWLAGCNQSTIGTQIVVVPTAPDAAIATVGRLRLFTQPPPIVVEPSDSNEDSGL